MHLFTAEGLISLATLIVLQLALAFANLLHIAIEVRRAPPEERANLRRLAVTGAVLMRFVLGFVLLTAIASYGAPLLAFELPGVIEIAAGFGALAFLAGGALMLHTALKEIGRLLMVENIGVDAERKGQKSSTMVVAAVIAANLLFSFQAVLAGVAITDSFLILSAALVIAAGAMIVCADQIVAILVKHRTLQVLGLVALFLTGVLLLSKGGAEAQLFMFDAEIQALSKPTFLFVVAAALLAGLAQSRFRRRLAAEKTAEIQRKT